MWADARGSSVHADGHKVGAFWDEDLGAEVWWWYPVGWRVRGDLEARGPYLSREAAKDQKECRAPRARKRREVLCV